MKTVTKYIFSQVAAKQLSHNDAATMIKELQETAAGNKKEIAIIGMAGKFPKAADLTQFWHNLINGVNCINDFPEARKNDCQELCAQSLYARILSGNKPEQGSGNDQSIYMKGGYLDEINKFDAAFFRISPKEAMFMDPLQRLFLETAYEAMEDAGYGGQKLYGAKVGVFVGNDHTNSTMYKYITETDEMQLTGTWAGILASRISYILNFRSPSMVIDTACSSGLVALYEACRAIQNEECDLAIAGGIHIQIFADVKNALYNMEMVESSDDYVRTFDKDASGTIWGEGAGALLVKPLDKAMADGDHIYAVLKGGAINNDGASSGIAAPNAEAQKELLIKAWKDAKVDPETISYIEAHGTGTKLGDPIEIKGITAAFEEFTTKKQFCGIGSVKTNVGHLVGAAGLASVIKVILALKNKQIPPSINFNSPNPFINFLNSPVYVHEHSRPWNSMDGVPRRAGVSAFGFSGTNCHFIFEEAPAPTQAAASAQAPGREILPASDQPGILTLSARNKKVLQEVIKRYEQFLEQTPEADLGSICYTANTGRGHYSHRIGLCVTNREDLKQKIARLKAEEPEAVRESGIFYGVHKIVPDQKTDRAEGELTENERRQLSAAAKEFLQRYIKTSRGTRDSGESLLELAAKLCGLYIQGADILWDELYQNQGFTKISMPVYPLERTKCWAPPNTARIDGLQINPRPIHPLLHKLLVDSLDQKIYGTEFSVADRWVLKEHRVLDYYIAPGTTYLEMARLAGREYYGDIPLELRDFMFIQPLMVGPDEKKEIQIIVKKEADYLDFTVASKTAPGFDGESWSIHAQGKIHRINSREARRYDLSELKAELDLAGEDSPGADSPGEDENFTFGPRWRNLVGRGVANDRALLQLKLPGEFQADLHDYGIHPALMDQAANAFSQDIDGMRLPLMYKRIAIYQRMPASFYCYLRRKDQGKGNQETILLDATLMDESGQVLIEIEDYSLKRVKDGKLSLPKGASDTFYYGFTWLPQEASAGASPSDHGPILIFKDETGIASRIVAGLKQAGMSLIEVETGSGYGRMAEDKYQITGAEADYYQLVDALRGQKITRIIHLMSVVQATGQPETLAELEEKQSKGLFSLFYLSRALAGYHSQAGIDLILIADNVNLVTQGEDRLNPVAAAFLGLGKTVFYENNQLRCRAIDIDHYTAAEKIVAEILAPGPAYQVAFRHNQRYIEEFQPVEPPSKPEDEIRDGATIRPGGVYLITGGTGGIGLEIGKFLAGKAQDLTLALISRTPMPERDSWDEVVTHGPDRKLQARIKAILEMEQAGVEVLIFSADIASEISLKPVLDELRQKRGQINGVIHAAGVAGAGFMIKKDIQTFKNVITPKIQGTWLLDKLTEKDDLDFIILFSSIGAITGAAGQSDYTAANSYLDSFAAYRNQRGKKTISVNWPLWEGVGMAADYGVTGQDLFVKPVTRNKALQILGEILAGGNPRDRMDCSRVIFGELNYPMIAAAGEELPFKVSERIQAAITKQKAQLTKVPGGPKERVYPKATVIGVDGHDEEQTISIMAQIWAGVLGLTEIDVNQNFYDMGGDSILASQILNEINQKYPDVIMISDIFNYPSIMELSRYIEAKGGLEHPGQSDSLAPVDLKIAPLPFKEYYPSGYYPAGYYPASSAQKRMFILHQIESENLNYNLSFVLLLEGRLDRWRLEEAFRRLIERQESLRTTFETVDGKPVQRIHPTVDFRVEYRDMMDDGDPAGNGRDRSVQDIIRNFVRPFDLSKAPLLRVGLFKIADTQHVLMYDLHHIVADGSSLEILMSELIAFYEGKNLPGLPIGYKDFAAWQNQVLQSERVKRQEEYWLRTFSGELPLLNLPLDYPRPAIQSYEGDRVGFEIRPELTGPISQIAAQNGATLYMVLLAALNVLLFKYTGQEDIIIGSPVAGRTHADLEKIIGVFINTLAMRNYPARSMTFKEFLATVKDHTLKAFNNQEYQFETLIENLNLRRDFSRNPLFDVMFILHNNLDISPRESMGVRLTPLQFANKTAKFDLTWEATEDKNHVINFDLEYCTRLFTRETILRFAEHYLNILTIVAANPDIPLGAIEILAREEKEQILVDFNNTGVEYQKEKLIHQLFEEQAARTPRQVALQFKNETLTYRELNEQAGRLAGALRRLGVKANEPVAIMVNRSLEMIIGIMAILKAGAAYLPIDPEYPGERIKYMLEDSETKVLLTQSALTAKGAFNGTILDVNDGQFYQGNEAQLEPINTARDLTYIIYTSGSTGQPKGVMIEHRAVHNFIIGITRLIDFSTAKTILALTTISFDIFGLETILALTRGLKIVIASEKEQLDPKLLSELMIQNRIQMLQITPSRLQLLLSDGRYRPCIENLTEIMIGGEALPEYLLTEVRKLTQAKIYNMYGPTETTIWSTVKDLTAETTVNIGSPIANTQIYILDPNHRPQPIGVVGELYIAGDGLARGYWKRPELTAEKFIINPFDIISERAPQGPPLQSYPDEYPESGVLFQTSNFKLQTSARLYKTGDLARWLPDGNIEFWGRADQQVKIRGYRIELGEIENQLLTHEAIQAAAVIDETDENGLKSLHAYYVAGRELLVVELRDHLGGTLPDYMIPASFNRLDRIPQTPNGKVDRKALPKTGQRQSDSGVEYVAPVTTLENQLAGIWQELLKGARVGIHDNFFTLGGNSLLVVLMHNRINELYPGKIEVTDVFAYPTIARLAQFIDTGKAAPMIQLEELTFPAEYFGTTAEGSGDLVFKFQISETRPAKLKNIADRTGVTLPELLLANYFYLLAEISEQPIIVVQTILPDTDQGLPLKIDLSRLTALPDLFGAVKQQFANTPKHFIYDIQQLNKIRIAKNKHGIIPFFADGYDLTSKTLAHYDLMLNVKSITDAEIRFTCHFNQQRLKKSQVEKLIHAYLKLVDIIIKKLEGSEKA